MKIFNYLLILIFLTISVSGCSSLIEADAKRFGFAFIFTLILGVVGFLTVLLRDNSD